MVIDLFQLKEHKVITTGNNQCGNKKCKHIKYLKRTHNTIILVLI